MMILKYSFRSSKINWKYKNQLNLQKPENFAENNLKKFHADHKQKKEHYDEYQ